MSPGHDKLFLLVILDEVFSSGIAEATQETQKKMFNVPQLFLKLKKKKNKNKEKFSVA